MHTNYEIQNLHSAFLNAHGWSSSLLFFNGQWYFNPFF